MHGRLLRPDRGRGPLRPSCESNDDCDAGFSCGPLEGSDDPADTYCLPSSGSCDCTPKTGERLRACEFDNEFGACRGVQTCAAPDFDAWDECTAQPASEELCDGVDNDCDGLFDEDLPETRDCANTVENVGSCPGLEVCAGLSGWQCQAPTPEVEAVRPARQRLRRDDGRGLPRGRRDRPLR